ncbi:hypothetical protein N7509_008964 [Penicillium cosmopolitanum]|uniref:RRM domain-containing protein n=1 Tax=Penicillium cosmopolitanum TaxID=1131564 RepID=A0A9W9VNJ2_9EURO|nr:uncharacterized protein N7509_008964 [Penicillium cosmopolitanum]KAJ5386423.1 hypothetical protein N7509_008964 [Penicillium cosmopolitanum]
MTEVSSTRLYLGNLPRNVTKQDIEEHFSTHGSGKITEIKLMNGFGFIEYEDAMDARDVVPAFHGSDFKGERLTVQFARGPRRKEAFPGPPSDRPAAPRPRRTMFRMQISGLPETSWQDLKDFARQSGLDVVYSETGREQGRGFVEFETANDLKTAVEKLDQREFKGSRVTCVADIQSHEDRPPRDPYRSRSRVGHTPPMDEYDRRFPAPRGYSPGITIVNGRPFRFAASTTNVMDMDVVLPHALGWKTTHPRVVPMRIHMMPGPRLPRATMMIHI